MAEGKKSFILYSDLLSVVEKLIKQDRKNGTNYAGELFYMILLYVNDQEPIPIDFIVELAFEPIKKQLKRDLKKYEITLEGRSKAGKASAEARKLKKQKEQNSTNSTNVKCVQQSSTNSTDNDNDNVNDTVTVNDILLKKETKEIFNTWLQYRKEIKKPIKSEKTKISLAKKIEKEGFEKSAFVINKSIQNGYQGLFWEQKNIKNNENIKQHTIGRQTIETIEANSRGWRPVSTN